MRSRIRGKAGEGYRHAMKNAGFREQNGVQLASDHWGDRGGHGAQPAVAPFCAWPADFGLMLRRGQ